MVKDLRQADVTITSLSRKGLRNSIWRITFLSCAIRNQLLISNLWLVFVCALQFNIECRFNIPSSRHESPLWVSWLIQHERHWTGVCHRRYGYDCQSFGSDTCNWTVPRTHCVTHTFVSHPNTTFQRSFDEAQHSSATCVDGLLDYRRDPGCQSADICEVKITNAHKCLARAAPLCWKCVAIVSWSLKHNTMQFNNYLLVFLLVFAHYLIGFAALLSSLRGFLIYAPFLSSCGNRLLHWKYNDN